MKKQEETRPAQQAVPSRSKKLLRALGLCILAGLGFGTVKAQQDPMYSQYMFNGLSINPAYAGSRDALSTTFIYRKQWVGLDGAPTTQSFSLHSPTRNRRNAFGFQMVNDRISYLGQTWLTFSYAYRLPVGEKGMLHLGLQASIYNYRINWSQAELIDPNDNVAATYGKSLWLPNAGTGAWYYTDKFYVGLSAPHLLVNSLDKNRPGISILAANQNIAALRRHGFFTAGYVFDLSPDVKFKPSLLLKYVYSAPLEMDVNAQFYFFDKLGVGGSYRTGDGMVAMINYYFTPQLHAGYAYDYPFTSLRGYTSGSHEIMIGYDFRFGDKSIVSPRVF